MISKDKKYFYRIDINTDEEMYFSDLDLLLDYIDSEQYYFAEDLRDVVSHGFEDGKVFCNLDVGLCIIKEIELVL